MAILEFFGGVWASIIIGIWFICLISGCAINRRYHNNGDVLVGLCVAGVLALVIWKWDYVTVDYLTSLQFWQPIIGYVIIGLVYALLEFVLELHKSKRYWAKRWEGFSWAPAEPAHKGYKPSKISEFLKMNDYGRNSSYPLVKIEDVKGVLTPVLDRGAVTQSVTSWTILWPGYLISLLIGDALTELFSLVGRVFNKIGDVITRLMFKGTFK